MAKRITRSSPPAAARPVESLCGYLFSVAKREVFAARKRGARHVSCTLLDLSDALTYCSPGDNEEERDEKRDELAKAEEVSNNASRRRTNQPRRIASLLLGQLPW